MFLQAAVAYAPGEEEAARAAWESWPVCTIDPALLEDLATPEEFAARSASARPEDVRGKLRVSADLRRHTAWLQADLDLGFSAVYLHHVGPNMERFIEVFGEHVLPALRGPDD
jgi:hypothetical protein